MVAPQNARMGSASSRMPEMAKIQLRGVFPATSLSARPEQATGLDGGCLSLKPSALQTLCTVELRKIPVESPQRQMTRLAGDFQDEAVREAR